VPRRVIYHHHHQHYGPRGPHGPRNPGSPYTEPHLPGFVVCPVPKFRLRCQSDRCFSVVICFADPRRHGRDADRETANTDPHRDDSSHGSSSRCNVKLASRESVIIPLAKSRSSRLSELIEKSKAKYVSSHLRKVLRFSIGSIGSFSI
jgi:hypothetical protein